MSNMNDMERRVAFLEYAVSKIDPNVFKNRSPVTNPVDDAEDGTDWSGHPWSVLVDKEAENDD